MRRCVLTPHFCKFAFRQICATIFLSQNFQPTPFNILVNFESGVHVFSVFLCRNAWNSAIHLFIIWFTDILAFLDIQRELQDCLYEYGFKDKWYKFELLASVLHVLHSDCIKAYFYFLWWRNATVKLPLSRPPTYFDARERDYIVLQTGLNGWAIFSVTSVSFQALFISRHLFWWDSNQAKAKNLSNFTLFIVYLSIRFLHVQSISIECSCIHHLTCRKKDRTLNYQCKPSTSASSALPAHRFYFFST